ncbi:hypothetical protein Q9R35_00920 [Alcaligenes sp. AB3]|uniref:hypothetical protein n=1 Tax=Alcaligenes sp. AB3 TaxID=2962569 RepID=UPI002882153F|nr:hypothetical protein [Alcaligenes sp. AB3]MDT0215873.1 hypothetical protein [Alcaligenes sp. AB3]
MYTIIETKEIAQSLSVTLLDYIKERGYMLCRGNFDLADEEFSQAPSYEDVVQAYEEVRSFLYVAQADPMGFKTLRDEASKEEYLELIGRIKNEWATPSENDLRRRLALISTLKKDDSQK